MTTVLFIGDPHIKVTEINVDKFISKTIELAREKNPTIICIGGDVLDDHKTVNIIALNKAQNMIRELREIAHTYILVGNHDYVDNKVFLTDEHWMNAMKEWRNVTIVDRVVQLNINDLLFTFAPYVFPGRFVEALNTVDNWIESDCIFAHQEFRGCKYGAIYSVIGDEWPLHYPRVVSGHIHEYQKPQDNIFYPGTPMQHSRAETKQKIIALLKWDDSKTFSVEESKLGLPRKITKRLELKPGEKISEKFDEKKYKDAELTISISSDTEVFNDLQLGEEYKKLREKGIDIVFKKSKSKKAGDSNRFSRLDSYDLHTIVEHNVCKKLDKEIYKISRMIMNDENINTDDILLVRINNDECYNDR